jgi:hypothetical protein
LSRFGKNYVSCFTGCFFNLIPDHENRPETLQYAFTGLKQSRANRLKAGSPGKLRALVARRIINPALMIFVLANSDLHIANTGIGDHNSTAQAIPDR